MKRIYFGCPYSHENKEVMAMRYESVTRATARLMTKDTAIFSPITHSHPVSLCMNGHTPEGEHGYNFWLAQDRNFLDWADEMWILMLPGWELSFGVTWEIIYSMLFRGMPVRGVDPVSLVITKGG